jgi:hypothetical protein
MTVLAFCMTPPWGAPKIRNPNGQSIEAEITLTGYYDGPKKASGLQMDMGANSYYPGKHYGPLQPVHQNINLLQQVQSRKKKTRGSHHGPTPCGCSHLGT